MRKIIRLEQWSKNFVIFIPSILAKNYEVFWDLSIYIIFLAFSLIVSSTYIFNDLLDLEQDRLHPQKKTRPLAAGNLSIKSAKFLLAFLVTIGFLVIMLTDQRVILLALMYVFITISYSFKLKYMKFFDFMSITILFGIRLIIGSVTSETELSGLLIVFILLFLTQISIGKKLSIYESREISDVSKVKAHLIKKYDINELERILKGIFLLSNIVFLYWSYDRFFENTLNFSLCLLALILFWNFGKKFIEDSRCSKTENFIGWVISSKMYLVGLLICGIVLVVLF
jgi:4-hydroxybenzoate polyprenyltransferase